MWCKVYEETKLEIGFSVGENHILGTYINTYSDEQLTFYGGRSRIKISKVKRNKHKLTLDFYHDIEGEFGLHTTLLFSKKIPWMDFHHATMYCSSTLELDSEMKLDKDITTRNK